MARRKSDATGPGDVLLSKALPSAIDAERSVLGGVLLSTRALMPVLRDLPTEAFHSEPHQILRDTMVALDAKGVLPDPVTIGDALRESGQLDAVGGVGYVAGLIDNVPRLELVDQYAAILRRKLVLRQGVEILSRGLAAALDADADESTLREIADALRDRGVYTGPGLVPVSDIIPDYFETKQRQMAADRAPGVPTGYRTLDRLLGGGLGPGLTVLFARPGGGKTANALDMARYQLGLGYSVGFFSMEMGRTALMDRLTAKEARVDLRRLRSGVEMGKEDCRRFIEAQARMESWRLYVDTTRIMPWREIAVRARARHNKTPLDVLYCDQTSFIRDAGFAPKERRWEVDAITKGAVSLSDELGGIPVIVLNQCRRPAVFTNKQGKVEDLNKRRPRLDELKESGSLEEDADYCIAPWRPDKEDPVPRSDDGYYRELAYLCLLKQRNGPTGDVPVEFVRNLASFEDTAPAGAQAT
jgi:replicative DNA helicase